MTVDPRGTRQKRGYGKAHLQERARWKRLVDAGGVPCCRCGGAIAPGARFHLDHNDDRRSYRGVAHPSCNVRAANRRRGSFPAPQPRPKPNKWGTLSGSRFDGPLMENGQPRPWSSRWFDFEVSE